MRISGAIAAMVVVGFGCTRAPTQLLVVVDSDLLPADRRDIVVEVTPVEPPGSPPTATQTFTLEPAPFSFGLVPPGGDPSRRVELVVQARDGAGALVVERVVRTGFLPEQTLRLPVFLAAACVGEVCDPNSNCDRGTCVPVAIDPTSLAPVRPGGEIADAGPVVGDDAGAPRCMQLAAAPRTSSGTVRALTLYWRGEDTNSTTYPVGLTYVDDAGTHAVGFNTTFTSSDEGPVLPVAPVGIETVYRADVSRAVAGLVAQGGGVELFTTGAEFIDPRVAPVAAAATLPGGAAFRRRGEIWTAWTVPLSVSIARIDLSGATPALVDMRAVPGSSAGQTSIAPAVDDVLVAFDDAMGSCYVARVSTTGGPTLGPVPLDTGEFYCRSPSIAELSGGTILVAYEGTRMTEEVVRFATLDAMLARGISRGLGTNVRAGVAAAHHAPVVPGTRDDVFVVWAQPGPGVAYRYQRADGEPLSEVSVLSTAAGASLTADELATLRATRVAGSLIIGWIDDGDVWLGTVECSPP